MFAVLWVEYNLTAVDLMFSNSQPKINVILFEVIAPPVFLKVQFINVIWSLPEDSLLIAVSFTLIIFKFLTVMFLPPAKLKMPVTPLHPSIV